MTLLESRVRRIREIGKEIAVLMDEAKGLRSEVLANLLETNRSPEKDKPTRMILDGTTVVTVALPKDEKCKDCSVTFEDYPPCEAL